MKRRKGSADMDLAQFMEIAASEGLATAEELVQFSEEWQANYDAGEPGFGTEKTHDDWFGGLQAWRGLREFAEIVREQDPILAAELDEWTQGAAPKPDFEIKVEKGN